MLCVSFRLSVEGSGWPVIGGSVQGCLIIPSGMGLALVLICVPDFLLPGRWLLAM